MQKLFVMEKNCCGFLHKCLFVKQYEAKVYHENPGFQFIMQVRHTY